MFESQMTQVAKALAHPLRRTILMQLADDGDGVSPSEMSKELNESLTNVSYHVRMLHDFEMITQVRTEPRRGAVEHYYVRSVLGNTAVRSRRIMEKELANIDHLVKS